MARNPEKRAELVEHLGELRTRLVRSVVYILAGMIVAWFFYDTIFDALTRQLGPVLGAKDKLVFTTMAEPFMLKMQVSLAAGLILVLPLLIFEIWGFISPGLTSGEKRPLRWTVPLAVFLFASGASLCYWILPMAFRWFATYKPDNAVYMVTLPSLIRFELLMLLAFGSAFELPVVLMLLAQVGIVNSKMLKDNWRYSVVIISVVAATLTPSNDVFSMATMTIPLVILYVASIGLVKFVEKRPVGGRR